MPQAATASVIKTALVERLDARPALANVNVLRYVPVNRDDIRTKVGTFEVIAMAESSAGYDNVVFTDGGLRFDEDGRLQVVLIEVHGRDSKDTQVKMEDRVGELLYEVLADIADQRNWDMSDVGLDVFDYCFFTPVGDRWTPGRLQQTGVFAAACELTIEVRSRRSFT